MQDYWAGKAQRHAEVSEQMRRNLYTMPEDMARNRYILLPLSTRQHPSAPHCAPQHPSVPLDWHIAYKYVISTRHYATVTLNTHL